MQSLPTAVERDRGADLARGEPSTPQMLHALSHGFPSLYRCAYRLLENQADAEDAVQDGLLAAYKHLNQFRGDARMSTWLHAIVANCARMQLRKRKRPNRIHVSLDSHLGEAQQDSLSDILVDHRPNPEDECHSSMLHGRLVKSAAQLSPILRRTFHLRFADDLSIEETARLLGVPTGTVKAQTARARAKLMKSVRETVLNRSRSCGSRL